MAISPETVEQVRQASDIVEVIDAVVPLKRSGAYYKALSPFNKEKTPSFMVSRERQSFKCYSSGHGGDVFKFIMLYDNVDFPTAVRRLAERAGVEIREDGRAPDQKVVARKRRLLSLHAAMAGHWGQILTDAGEGEPGRHYLKQRDIPLSWVKEYGLGYAPDRWDETLLWGRREGYTEEEMLEAGLVVKNDRGKVYDRFRGRLIFSIHDDQGQIIGFSARLLDPEAKAAKYVNSPETPLFTKSRVLFGFHRARRAILNEDRVIVCEGQIDVLRCQACGVENVVAPLGTSFTPDHAKLIRRHTRNVVLCLDSDRAGKQAATRAADLLIGESGDLDAIMQSDLGIFVIPMPDGEDPDSFILREGVEAFQERARRPVDYLDFLLSVLREQNPDASGKRKMIEEVADFLVRIPNRAYREQLAQQAASRLEISFQAMEEEIRGRRHPRRSSPRDEVPDSNGKPEMVMALHPEVRSLLMIVLARPETITLMQRHLDWHWVEGLDGIPLLEKIIALYNDDVWHEAAELIPYLEGAEQSLVAGMDTSWVEGIPVEQLEGQMEEQIIRKAADLKQVWVRSELERITTRLKSGGLSHAEQLALVNRQQELKRL